MTDRQKTTQAEPRAPFEGLTPKEKELIAVGASIAAGCQPCTAYHFRAARAAGAGEEEIRRAVDDALCVRQSATKVMAELAEKHLGNTPEPDSPCCSDKSLIGELVSIGAALAVNCVANLNTHLTAACRLGATYQQIETALRIAGAVKKMAGEKVEAAVKAAAAAVTEAGDGCADDCVCHTANGQPSQATPEPAGCGCGETLGTSPRTPPNSHLAYT